MESSDPGSRPGALTVFADWLSRGEGGQASSFEALVEAHPEHARELANLRETWVQLAAAGDPSRTSLRERVEARFGPDSAPPVTLRPAEPGYDPDHAADLVARLSSRGPRFGRYEIRGEVARGGMGAILRVWDGDLHRHLAMKVILGQAELPASGSTPPLERAKVARFLEEAQVTGQLDHPGIVPVHELGLDAAGRLYFTMKLVKGESLHTIFEHVREEAQGWTRTRALNVLLRVCEAMSYAHAKGVIHRDLKPANVMVGKFGEVHVMDWGLSRIEGEKDCKDVRIRVDDAASVQVRTLRPGGRRETPSAIPLFTMDGDVIGTPAFMPPEQAAGKVGEVGRHSDVYSLGAMLYHLLAGHPPYVEGAAGSDNLAVLERVLEGPPRAIEGLAPDLSPELAAICTRAMARNWRERYRDMSELSEDLSAYLNQRVVRAYETGTWAETKKWVRRNQPLAVSLAAGMFAVTVGAVSFAWKAKEATKARDELAVKNGELESANGALFKARGEAITNSERAERGESAAQENARLAQLARDEATKRASELLSMSAQKDLEDLLAEAGTLWPAHPDLIPAYESWLARAKELIDGRPADDLKGQPERPGLAEHQAKLAELRSHALPLSDAEQAAERQSHPRIGELRAKQAELSWRSRMLGLESRPSETEVEAGLSKESLPDDADALNKLAFLLVDPQGSGYGNEVRALLLAQRALAAAREDERYNCRDTIAWALFRLGRFEEALEEKHASMNEPGGGKLPKSLAMLEREIASWTGGALVERRQEHAALAAEVAELGREVARRRTFTYEEQSFRWWDSLLSKLVSELEAFRDPRKGPLHDAVAEPFGWGISKRCDFAKQLRENSTDGIEAKRRWSEAIAAVGSSPKYGGLELVPELGLLPIGADPDSQLWEFAHLETGEPAVRGADGRLTLGEETGIVFVLIPSGLFTMGAQLDPGRRNYDPRSNDSERPLREVEVSAFFLSKFEMTQGQWERMAGANPSLYGPRVYAARLNRSEQGWSSLLPVEQVSWLDSVALLRGRLGLRLPSEAEWEYAARAGTTSAYWTGGDLASIEGAANLSDAYGKTHGNENWDQWEADFDDGHSATARVGSFRANPFGLHDVIGNLWEWCEDCYVPYAPGRQKDPVAETGFDLHTVRGGCFQSTAVYARSAIRIGNVEAYRNAIIGVRPAKTLARP